MRVKSVTGSAAIAPIETTPKKGEWYKITNAADDNARIDIYDYIGVDFWSGEGVSAKQFAKDLRAVKAKRIDLHINSEGGQVFEGIAIHNAIKQHKANVTVHVDGIAASIASIIAMAGDEIRMASNAFMMIHDPIDVVWGTSEQMRKSADDLDKIKDKLAQTYADRGSESKEKYAALMAAETWLTAEEAQEVGLIDAIDGESEGVSRRAAACLRFGNAPRKLKKLATVAGESQPLNEATKMADETATATEAETENEKAANVDANENGDGNTDAADTASASEAVNAAKPATIAELRTIQGASADSVLAWAEAGLTLAQAKTVHAAAPKPKAGGPGLKSNAGNTRAGDFMSQARAYASENKCTLRNAMSAVANANPSLHEQFCAAQKPQRLRPLEDANKN